MHTGRVTRANTQRAGIGEALVAIANQPPPAAGPSNTHHSPPSAHGSASDFLFNPPANLPIQEGDDPDEPDDPDSDGEQNNSPAEERNLAQALELLAQKIGGMPMQKPKSSIKPRVPDTFDGSDPNKLEAFTFQCNMYLAVRSGDFPDDESRVTFVLSYLKGSPQDWFQSELNHAMTSGQLPAWFTSYQAFTQELQRLFGPRDPITDAMNSLENLKLKDSGKATRYIIDFNRYSRKTGWNEQALFRQFYKGLPDRLKDEIARIGKPVGLKPLQDLVATLDQRYWERQSEITKDKKASATTSGSTSNSGNKSNTSEQRSDTRSDNRSNSQQSSSRPDNRQQQRNKDHKKPTPSTSSTSEMKPNPIANLLGPDGKLTPEERKRRLDNKLCLRCGKTGHMVADCPQTSKPRAKARAATAAASATTSATPSGAGKG
jgi:hypothetical protein